MTETEATTLRRLADRLAEQGQPHPDGWRNPRHEEYAVALTIVEQFIEHGWGDDD